MDKPKLIKTWDELKDCKSETHELVIDEYRGHICDKKTGDYCHYLSTHTFYGSQYKNSTEILQECGFNVIIDNWDKNE